MPEINEPYEVIAEEKDHGTRVDKWLSGKIESITRSRLQAIIKDGGLSRNGTPFTNASAKIQSGDIFVITIPPTITPDIVGEEIAIDIHYEDDDLIVINKPSGLVVHPGAGNQDGTLVNALIAHCGDSLSGIGGVARPGIVHRIDKDTSGLLVVAKHDEAHIRLAADFAKHNIDRIYHAIVIGALRPGVGSIETLIGRNQHDRKKMSVIPETDNRADAKLAITHYQTLERFATKRAKLTGDALASLVECKLETGRTHQIRVHLTHLGAPLIGDPVYGRGPGLAGLKPEDDLAKRAIFVLKNFRRQALHAKTLGFRHPISKENLYFEAPLSQDLAKVLGALKAL